MKEITSKKSYEERISRVLITEEEIAAAVKQAAAVCVRSLSARMPTQSVPSAV